MYVNTCVRKLLQPLTIASALSSYFLQQNSNLRDEPTAITEIVMNVYRRPTGAPDNAGLHFGHTAQFFFIGQNIPHFVYQFHREVSNDGLTKPNSAVYQSLKPTKQRLVLYISFRRVYYCKFSESRETFEQILLDTTIALGCARHLYSGSGHLC